jgi:hypothetical protein
MVLIVTTIDLYSEICQKYMYMVTAALFQKSGIQGQRPIGSEDLWVYILSGARLGFVVTCGKLVIQTRGSQTHEYSHKYFYGTHRS